MLTVNDQFADLSLPIFVWKDLQRCRAVAIRARNAVFHDSFNALEAKVFTAASCQVSLPQYFATNEAYVIFIQWPLICKASHTIYTCCGRGIIQGRELSLNVAIFRVRKGIQLLY